MNFKILLIFLITFITLEKIEFKIFQYLITVREISSNEINRNSLFIIHRLDTTNQKI